MLGKKILLGVHSPCVAHCIFKKIWVEPYQQSIVRGFNDKDGAQGINPNCAVTQ